jgi:Mrp family chromosome partitioning ATPase
LSKMFDALRRAESERRRKQEESTPASTALESVPAPARDTTPSPASPAPSRAPRREAPAPFTPASPALVPTGSTDPFPRDMLRELGILRNSLESRLDKKAGRVLMFTSAMHGEGVTTLATAYARLLAMHNENRVLLIELNARTPALASRLGLTATEGVTHYFSSRRALATVVSAPPVVVCPETPPLAPFVDGVVLVVHSGRTKRETVERSVKQIQQFQGRVLGVVLNRKRYYIPDFIYKRL